MFFSSRDMNMVCVLNMFCMCLFTVFSLATIGVDASSLRESVYTSNTRTTPLENSNTETTGRLIRAPPAPGFSLTLPQPTVMQRPATAAGRNRNTTPRDTTPRITTPRNTSRNSPRNPSRNAPRPFLPSVNQTTTPRNRIEAVPRPPLPLSSLGERPRTASRTASRTVSVNLNRNTATGDLIRNTENRNTATVDLFRNSQRCRTSPCRTSPIRTSPCRTSPAAAYQATSKASAMTACPSTASSASPDSTEEDSIENPNSIENPSASPDSIENPSNNSFRQNGDIRGAASSASPDSTEENSIEDLVRMADAKEILRRTEAVFKERAGVGDPWLLKNMDDPYERLERKKLLVQRKYPGPVFTSTEVTRFLDEGWT